MTQLSGFGWALPEHELSPATALAALGSIWPKLRGVEAEEITRYTVLPPDQVFQSRPLGERMSLYRVAAPRLAAAACAQAMRDAGVTGADIDLVVAVSCTGYLAPSLDIRIAAELGLRPDVLRLPLTEFGCSGGGAGLAVAHRHLESRPGDTVLLACVELCSLTFQPEDRSIDNLSAALVFGDGAAATVLTGRSGGLEIVRTANVLLPGSGDVLGFELGDGGFRPVLDRSLPRLLEQQLPAAISSSRMSSGSFQAVHAGGPRIFDAVERALHLGRAALQPSRSVFRRYGNLSSASILLVLAEPQPLCGDGLALSFGPGVSVELAQIRRSPE